MAQAPTSTASSDKDKLLNAFLGQVSKKYGDTMVMRANDSRIGSVEVIPTGSPVLDVALGVGGYPRGRLIEIFGPESAGKTTMAIHAMAEAQRQNSDARVLFIDLEQSFQADRAARLGVDVAKLDMAQPDTGEEAFDLIDMALDIGLYEMIVVDSVAAMTPRAELEADFGQSQPGLQARMMAQGLRKISAKLGKSKTVLLLTNQLREKIGVMYGCFDYDQRVVMADGSTEKIGKLVNQRSAGPVMSYDPVTGQISSRRIIDHYINGQTDKWLKLDVAGGSGRRHITCTPEHIIMTPGGERRAADLAEGDEVMVAVKEYTLTADQRQLILGSLLGDGDLRPVGNYSYAFRAVHGTKQAEYAQWKYGMLAPFANKMTGTENNGVGFDTMPMVQLSSLHAQAYSPDGRTISDQMIADLDARAVAVWYADGGTFSESFQKWGDSKAEICNKSLTRADQERLAERLAELGMGRPTVGNHGLVFSGERTRLFMEAIAPFLPPVMDYKLHPKQRGRFSWQPEAPVDRASSARLLAMPMRVIRRREVAAEPGRGNRFDIQVEGNHTYLADHVVVHNSPETQPGGKALKFYDSVRMRISRTGDFKKGPESVGQTVKISVVKNKVAAPHKIAEDIILLHATGVDVGNDLMNVGIASKIIQRAGAFYSIPDCPVPLRQEKFQGREALREELESNAEAAAWLRERVLSPDAIAEAFVPETELDEPVEAPDDELEPPTAG